MPVSVRTENIMNTTYTYTKTRLYSLREKETLSRHFGKVREFKGYLGGLNLKSGKTRAEPSSTIPRKIHANLTWTKPMCVISQVYELPSITLGYGTNKVMMNPARYIFSNNAHQE